jgi:hypothetical protein
MMPDTEITEYGFRMGAATVERMAMIKGDAVIRLRTPKQEMTIRVTPSGLIRFDQGICPAPGQKEKTDGR